MICEPDDQGQRDDPQDEQRPEELAIARLQLVLQHQRPFLGSGPARVRRRFGPWYRERR